MQYFPIFLNLSGQPVLVVGGGPVGERKARQLLKAGAAVRVVGESLTRNLTHWAGRGELAHLAERYAASQLEGVRLVFAATGDRLLNQRIFDDAEACGIPVNVVDDPKLCRFISPAIVDRSPVLVAISTGGASPVLARRLKARIDAWLPRGLGRVARAAADLRGRVKRALPASRRRDFWESCLDESRLQRWSSMPVERIRQEMASTIHQRQARTAGRVYLVGAGPGRPDLLTLRAVEVLQRADVILHDRLVPQAVLDLARRDAERIYVGKRAGNHHCTQRQIHETLIAQARRGRLVVRLKGGDPFVFGRGGEELEALRAAGVEYEVVPGVTAALGCAAYAGIPLTHRDHAHRVTFLTGHQAGSRPGGTAVTDWQGIAGDGRTVVVYMGLGQANRIRRELLDAGISKDLPLALVSDGTRDGQRVLHGRVVDLDRLARLAADCGPSLLIIGQVAALGSNLAWFEQQPAARAAA